MIPFLFHGTTRVQSRVLWCAYSVTRCWTLERLEKHMLKSGPVSAPDSLYPPPGKPRKTPGFRCSQKTHFIASIVKINDLIAQNDPRDLGEFSFSAY